MERTDRDLRLDYLIEYPLGVTTGRRRRNVPLKHGKVKDLQNRVERFRADVFALKQARCLEGRADREDGKGVWPINHWRCQRRMGTPGDDLFPWDAPLSEATPAILAAALEMRILCYHRAANAMEAKELVLANQEVRYSSEITTEWYDPPDGAIQLPDEYSVIRGSHAVPIIAAADPGGFEFPNSWGCEWGDNGWGKISYEHFDRSMIEAWNSVGAGLFVPITANSGAVCLEWKWSLNDAVGVHGRDVVNASTGERLAWAFCKRRSGYLDVEEFFVWPSERRKSYGRTLATMVKALAHKLRLPLRLLVSYADTEPANRTELDVAARLLGVHLEESPERWVHWVGTAAPTKAKRTFPRPQRPAFILESLRPRDEKPNDTPIEYTVFFGTNRRPDRADAVGFGAQRDDRLITGAATVTIPRSHRFGSKGSFWVKLWNRARQKHPRITGNRFLPTEAEFSDAIAEVVGEFKERRHNLLYVHGFNTTFEAASVQAAHFGVDLKIPGATFVFSWPSAGQYHGYLRDEATIEASQPLFENFIRLILQSTGDVPLNVVAHSMGNRAIVRFLESVARGQQPHANGRINNVLFAAPDVDADVFRSALTQFGRVAERATLYSTWGDIALFGSERLHDYPRAGLAPPVLTAPGLDTVLVEAFNLLSLGHQYYAEAAAVLHDMFQLLHHGTTPSARAGLIPADTLAGERYWKLSIQ